MREMSQVELPLFVALTVDVDPDANRPSAGRAEAVGPHRDGEDVCLEACRAGLEALGSILEDQGIPCTFFWEARSLQVLRREAPGVVSPLLSNRRVEHGCHGLRHEDFSGKDSGLPLGRQRTRAIVEEASRIVACETGCRPVGFRAPYCRLTPELKSALHGLDYTYDASLTRSPGPGWRLRPYNLLADGVLWELALCRGKDSCHMPITSYLWQLFEGRRRGEQYVAFVAGLAGQYGGGLCQIALHPWHLVVSEHGRPLGARPPDELSDVLSALRSLPGVEFVNAREYLGLASQGGPSRL